MSDVIKLLPDSVANQIAAGEVIQRPASIVKELVENSVDAGADNIQVIIRDAGRTLVQVVDNGCGMSPTDARLAFERHSTSKITVAQDLFTLRTMGFRGEALASIAAVSQVELKTQRRDDTLGTKLVISGSKVELQEPVASSPGSNMMVKNLFFNVPARRKFLKKDTVELSNILHEFERLALVNPGIELSLVHNDSLVHQLTRGSLKSRIGGLFGKSVERQLIPVGTETSMVKIEGFVSLPESARKRGALQYFFVNGRNMRHPYFHKAVIHCYEQLIRADEQPNYFINFTVDPATIDVNIHPTKNEIKFENEQAIWQILVAAIRESLGRFNVVPSIDFENAGEIDIPAYNPDVNALNGFTPGDKSYNPFINESIGDDPNAYPQSAGAPRGQSAGFHSGTIPSGLKDWDKLYERFTGAVEVRPTAPDDLSLDGAIPSRANAGETLFADSNAPEFSASSIIQVKNKYLLTPIRDGLIVVDQHRAHVKVLYERFTKCDCGDPLPSQKVLFPELVNLTLQQNIKLREVESELAAGGFELESAGPNVWAINGVPPVDVQGGVPELLKSILDELLAETADATRSVRQVIALNIARAGAIRGGKQLTATEMEQLLSELFSLATPTYTPDGLKVISQLDVTELERLF